MLAQKVVTLLTDDFGDGDADETIQFGFNGTNYVIDLTDENAAEFREAMGPYVEAARRVTANGHTPHKTAARSSRPATGVDPRAVRAWANANGVAVSPRGRIATEVIEQYRAAGN